MPATITPIDPALLAFRDGDRPLLLPLNHVVSNTVIKANTTRFFTTADGSDAAYPLRNLYDLGRKLQWRYGSAQATVYILIDFGAVQTVDALVIEGHDASLANSTITVRASNTLAAAPLDDLTLATTVWTGAIGPTTERRAVFLDSTYAARYWEITLDTAPAANVKHVTQMWLASQVIMPHNPTVPHDELRKESLFTDVISKSGNRSRVGWFHNLARRDFRVWVNHATTIAALRQAYLDTAGWAAPLWWFDFPNSDPNDGIFGFVEEPGINLESIIDLDRIWENAIVESGPHIDSA